MTPTQELSTEHDAVLVALQILEKVETRPALAFQVHPLSVIQFVEKRLEQPVELHRFLQHQEMTCVGHGVILDLRKTGLQMGEVQRGIVTQAHRNYG